MANISTKYMGFDLKSPIIASAGPLTENVDSLKRLEDAGVGAVVLKSIFEEQIEEDSENSIKESEGYLNFPAAESHFMHYKKNFNIDKYMKLLMEAKKSLGIPVIASVCCKTKDGWSEYVDRFVSCGADAIELNYYPISSDSDIEGKDVDKKLLEFARSSRKSVGVKLSLKLGNKYSSIANIIKSLDELKIDSVVMFNKFYEPDINIDTLSFTSAPVVTEASDYTDTLRWVGLMAGEINMQICANTGIHSGKTAIKMILAGAGAVQVCSALMKGGPEAATKMNNEISEWMDKKGYSSIDDFRGIMAQENNRLGFNWERTQFLKMI